MVVRMSRTAIKLAALSTFQKNVQCFRRVRPVLEAREVPSEYRAKMDARRMAALGTYAGVITWSRSADLVSGEFGEPVVLFQHGDVPEME